MSRFVARALGQGLIDWSPEAIDAYAYVLREGHSRWPDEPNLCRACGDQWPCAWAAWAEAWANSITRATAYQRRS